MSLTPEDRVLIERELGPLVLEMDYPAIEWAGLARLLNAARAEGPVTADGDVAGLANEVVTRLYRRFKDWSRRGFGPEDVTWCEVKADVLELIALSAPAKSDELRKALDHTDARLLLRMWARTIPNGPWSGELEGMALRMGDTELQAFLCALSTLQAKEAGR